MKYVVIACSGVMNTKLHSGGIIPIKGHPEHAGGAFLLGPKGRGITVPFYQYSNKKISALRKRAHEYIDTVFDQMPDIWKEISKIETFRKKDLPLLVGSLQYPEAQELLAKKIKSYKHKV